MNDRDLVKRFHEQKQVDEKAAPSFEQMWSIAQARLWQKRRQRLFRFAAVAILILTVGLSWQSIMNPPEAASITTWQSPTGDLLKREDPKPLRLISSPPRVITSISDWRSPTAFLLDKPVQDTPAASQ